MKKKTSKQVPHEECTECGFLRPVYRRSPRVMCKNCTMRVYPPVRKRAVCANWQNCKKGTAVQEIVARGLCGHCYQWFRLHGRLAEWPKTRVSSPGI